MSLLIRPKRPSAATLSSLPTATARTSPEAEAPESASCHFEAPEARSQRHREAPEAGEGRGHYFEHEFTNGRSQS